MERNDLFSPFLDLHKSKGHVYFPWLFWAAARKGTKSCRTQGDFLSSVILSVHPSAPQALSGLKSALSGLESVRAGIRP